MSTLLLALALFVPNAEAVHYVQGSPVCRMTMYGSSPKTYAKCHIMWTNQYRLELGLKYNQFCSGAHGSFMTTQRWDYKIPGHDWVQVTYVGQTPEGGTGPLGQDFDLTGEVVLPTGEHPVTIEFRVWTFAGSNNPETLKLITAQLQPLTVDHQH